MHGLRSRTARVRAQVTQDLLIELTGELVGARWMWQARNVGYETDKPAGRAARPITTAKG